MNYELSLDDIIKMKRSRNSRTPRKAIIKKPALKKTKKNNSSINNSKVFSRSIKKSNTTAFKQKIRKRTFQKSAIPDARVKILQNKKRLGVQNKSPLIKGTVLDARLKIEQRRNKTPVRSVTPKRNFGVTKVAPDGIIQRKVSALRNDSGVSVEYEEEDMNLEDESLNKIDWNDRSLTIRRTVHNFQDNGAVPKSDERGHYNNRTDFLASFYRNDDDDVPFKEVTRTISNIKRSPLITRKKNYNTSPVRQFSYEDDGEISHSRLSPLSNTSPLLARESNAHRIMISNLHENVTGEDIKELFEDVGDLLYAKMIRTGMAEVAYKSQKDATKAVEIYHNRQLDGLPMKCMLVSNNTDLSIPKKRNPGYIPPVSTFQSVEPDTRLIKRALFSS